MGTSKSTILTAADNKYLPNGGQNNIAQPQQKSTILTAADNQFIKKKEDTQPLNNGSNVPSQSQSLSTSENIASSLPVDYGTMLNNAQGIKPLSYQDIQNIPVTNDNKKLYDEISKVKSPSEVSNDMLNLVNTYYDTVNPVDVNKFNGFGQRPAPVYGSDATRVNKVLPPNAAVQYNNSISQAPLEGDAIEANRKAKRDLVTGIQQGDPQKIKQFKDLATKTLQDKIDLIDKNPQGAITTEGVAMEYQPAKTVYHLSDAQVAEKKMLQSQIDNINNTFNNYTQIALVDKASKKPGGIYADDNVIDLGNQMRSYNGTDIPRESDITDKVAKTEVNYLNEQAGLNAIRDVKRQQYAGNLKAFLNTNNPQSKEDASYYYDQLNDINNRIQTLPDKYAPVRISYVARLMGEYISNLHPVMNVFITDADRRKAVENIEKDYPGFSAKYAKEINFINSNGGIETLIPHQGFIGALNRGGVQGTEDIINFGKDLFGIRKSGDRAADEAKNEFDAYMRGTAQSGGGKVVLNKDGLTFEQRDDENYNPTNFNSAMSKIGNFIGGIIPFVATTELGGEGASALVGRVNKISDAISGISKAKKLANLADFGETDILGMENALQPKIPALSAAQKQFAGNIVGNYVMNFDNNLNTADKLIKDQSSAGDAKKALVANLLTWGQIAAFSALPQSQIAKDLVSKGLERDAAKMIADLGEENVLNAASQKGFKDWAANYVAPRILSTVNTLKNTGTTTAKGLSEMVLMNHLNAGISNMFDETGATKNHNVWDEDLQTIKDMGLGMIGLAGIGMLSHGAVKGLSGYFTGEGGVPNVLREMFPMTTRDALYEAAGNVDENVSRIRNNIENGTIDKDRGNQAISIIRTAGEMYPLVVNAENEGLPKTTKQKAQMLAEMVRGRLLEQADKKQGIPELMQGVNDNLDAIQADNRYNQVQPIHDLEGNIIGHEPLGEPLPTNETHPVKIGDEVQWTQNGVEKFEEPKKVTGISADGTHIFVEDSKTAIPIHEIENLSSLKTNENERNNSGIKEGGNEEALSQSIPKASGENSSKEEGNVSQQNTTGSGLQQVGKEEGVSSTENTPSNTFEQRKADIERRRQEDLNDIHVLNKGNVNGSPVLIWGVKSRPNEIREFHLSDAHKEVNAKYDAELKALEEQFKNSKNEKESNNNEAGNAPVGEQSSRQKNGQENGLQRGVEEGQSSRPEGSEKINEQEKIINNETERQANVNVANKENLDEQSQSETNRQEPGISSENGLRLEHGDSEEAITSKNVENAIQKQTTGEMGIRNEAAIRKEMGGHDQSEKPSKKSEEGGEERKVGVSHEALSNLAKKLGLPEPERGKRLTPEEYAYRGRLLLNAGADVEKLEKDFKAGKQPTADDISVARAHLEDLTLIADAMKDKFGLDSPQYDNSLKEIERFTKEVVKPMGTEASVPFTALQGQRDLDTNSFTAVKTQVQDLTGKKTTKEQDEKIEKLTSKNDELQKQVDSLQKELVEATDKALKEQKSETDKKEKVQRKSHADFVKEREKAVSDAREALKKIRTGQSGLTAVPIPFARELAAIAPHVGTIVKSYVEEGVIKLEDVIDRLYDTFKDDLIGLRRRDVIDLISGAHIEKKESGIVPSKENTLKRQAQLVAKLEDLEAGIPEEKNPKQEQPKEIQELLKKIAKVKKDLANMGYLQKSPEQKSVERLEKELKDLQDGKTKDSKDPRKKSEREKELMAQIKELKDSLGITEKERQKQNIRRLEDELEEAKKDRLKKKPDDRKLSQREKDLQAQLNDEKTRILGNQLAERFLNKTDNKFLPDDAKDIWDYAKQKYIEKGVEYRDMIKAVANDLGLTWKQVSDAITSPKVKRISDEMWKKQHQLRRNQLATKIWIDEQDKSAVGRFFKKVSGAFRSLAVFGHGGIFIGTHAGATLFQPTTWKHTIPAFFRGWKFAYGNVGNYERAMEDLKNSPNYIIAQRAGLKNNPDLINAEEYQKSQKYLGNVFGKVGEKLGGAGERGFNAIKVLRQNLFDVYYNNLSAADKQDPNVVKSIAHLINNATGATNLNLPNWVNEATFTGGMEAARWGKLTRNPVRATATALRAIANPNKVSAEDRVFAKVWARRVGEQLATYGSILVANAAIQSILNPKNPVNLTNPAQSDWLKFKFGDEQIDPTSGMLGVVNFIGGLGRIATENQKQLHGDTRLQALGKLGAGYGRGKLAPFYSTLVDFATQSDFYGNPLPYSEDKPRTGKHKLSWVEYAGQKLPLPIAEALNVTFKSAEENGMGKTQIKDVMRGILSGALSGTTGFRVAENKEKIEPFSEEEKNAPELKYFVDKGLELPNTSPQSETITDEESGTKKKLSEYPKSVQKEYADTHKQILQQELNNILSNQNVYVKSYTDGQGNTTNEVSLNAPSGNYKVVSINDLDDTELEQILHIAQSKATKETKKQLFNKQPQENF